VERLDADGGTVMLPALEASLGSDRELTPIRQVVFITDGCVGNEDQLFAAIRSIIGRTRLFTVGIGSAPNAHFMERAARFGRGTFTYIGHVGQTGEKMRELFGKIDSPVVTDIDILWPDAQAEWYPRPIRDLYGGEPLVVAARVATLGGEVLITGYRGEDPWEVRIPVEAMEGRGGIHQLWARRKIGSLMDELGTGAPADQIRAELIEVALRHHLASSYTSLVAVDVTPSRPAGEGLDRSALATRLPHGWTASKVFGQFPKGATFASMWMLLGMALAAIAVALRLALGVFR
jgi:Ca-activated chloride channel family protein